EKQILEIAKSAVIASVKKQGKVKYNFEFKPLLNDEYSAFVTLKKHGDLRGCVGQIFATNPLWMSIEDAGKNAALHDTRFSPVTVKELGELEFEVTVLSRMKKILSPNEIVIGRDGVYLRIGLSSAIFLPQVAPEQNWNTTQLLQNLCRKAGLPNNAYTSPEAELYIFQALIIE
ncbi:MAG: AmmeMemoRadiSam system protein A, partial [Bacteroidota bacterium]